MWHCASTIQRNCIHTHYQYVPGRDLNGKKSFWDRVTKLVSKYSLHLGDTRHFKFWTNISATKRPPKGSSPRLFAAQVQYKGIVYTRTINTCLAGIWTAKLKHENNYVKLYNSVSFWDTVTKLVSKYSLHRPPLGDTCHFKFLTNISATKRPPKGNRPRLFAALWHWASTIQRDCVHTYYEYVAGKDLNGKKSFWDTVTKLVSKYSLHRPLSETPVILNLGQIFRLQNGPPKGSSPRLFAAQVQYKGIV